MTRRLPRRQNSRYRGTPAFQLRDRNTNRLTSSYAYGVWEPPSIVKRRNRRVYRVQRKDVGRLDLLAQEFLESVNLWWVIAYTNNISDPTTDMFVGQELEIPSLSDVRRAMTSLETQGRLRGGIT